jgi:hypothetical protein
MITVLQRTAVISACVLLSGLSVPLAHASGDRIPDPPQPGGTRPSSSTTYDLKPSEFSLTVSPTRLVIEPADIGKVSEILIVNRGQAPVPVTVQEKNFTGGSDGALNYQDDAPYGAASWMTVSPESFVVEPGKAQVVTTTITMPPAPELGDHHVALVFLVPAGETNGNVKVNRGVGVPAYITVPGPTDDSVSLGGLIAPGFALGGPALGSVGGPVDISTTVRNVGTVHHDFRAKAPLMIENAGASASFPDFTVMRGATRDVTTAWQPPLMCICHPTVAVAAADGTMQQATARVVVFPLQWLAIALATALIIFFAVRWRRRRYQAAVQNAAARLNDPVSGGNA